jgi:Asp-tRNA(Asn)/Glu-tRNA(Gln) amidotransferase A subunit family amidase
VVGLKVTHGRIPLTGVFPLAASLDTVGPIARTVADAITAYLVMAGHDPADPWSIDAPADRVDPIDPAGLTFGIPHPWVDRPLAPLQEAGFAQLCSTLSALGATVVDVDAPILDQHELKTATYYEVGEVHREWFRSDPERYGPAIRHRLAPVLDLTAEEIEIGQAWRNRIVAGFGGVFEGVDVLVTPGTAAASKQIGSDTIDVGAGAEPSPGSLRWSIRPASRR